MNDFRKEARHQLQRAMDELATNDDERLKYAALELRFALESLAYDRAAGYGDEFPETEYSTWQPRKVLTVLLELDPQGRHDKVLSWSFTKKDGQPKEPERVIGIDHVIKMDIVKKHYDALGSHLHVPTLDQRNKGKVVNSSSLRHRCEAVAAAIEKILASTLSNIHMASVTKFNCLCCDNFLVRRMPPLQRRVDMQCPQCSVGIRITANGDGTVTISHDFVEFECGNLSCRKKEVFWPHEAIPGAGWDCRECSSRNDFVLTIANKAADAPAA